MYIQFSSQLALHIRKCSRVFYLKMVNDVQNLKLCVFAGHIRQALTSFFFCYTYAAPSQQILLPLYSCENSSWTLLHWNVGVLISLTSCVLILLDFNAGGVLWAVVLFRCYLVAITQLLDVRCVFFTPGYYDDLMSDPVSVVAKHTALTCTKVQWHQWNHEGTAVPRQSEECHLQPPEWVGVHNHDCSCKSSHAISEQCPEHSSSPVSACA